MAKLTVKQELFVKEYLVDLNASAAVLRAGYDTKYPAQTAATVMESKVVKAAIQAEMDQRSEKTNISAEYVINTIKDTIERCQQVKPVLNRNGDPVLIETESGDVVPSYAFDSKGVLKGCELLGKHLKLFTDKVEQETTLHVVRKQYDAD